MKIPFYLKLLLILTVLLSCYVLITTEDDPQEVSSASYPTRSLQKSKTDSTSKMVTDDEASQRVDIFPFQINKEITRQQLPKSLPVKKTIKSPILPYTVAGAIWLQRERVLVLKNNGETWTICQRCESQKRIWEGYLFDSGWRLLRVQQDALIFQMENGRDERRIALDEYKTKPVI